MLSRELRAAVVAGLLAGVTSCASAPPLARCSTGADLCRIDAQNEMRAADAGEGDARLHADRAGTFFEQACEQGDAESCKEATRFWLARESEARGAVRDKATDKLTLLPVTLETTKDSAAIARARAMRFWVMHEKVAYRRAEKEPSVAAWEAFLREHPHAPNAGDARDHLYDLELRPIVTQTRSTGVIDPLLAFVETHLDHAGSRRALLELGTAQRKRVDLSRMARIADASADPALRRFAEECRDVESQRALDEAMALPRETRVSALRTWRAEHPQSPRIGAALQAESDAAFALASEKRGSAAVDALRGFIAEYPTSTRRPEAKTNLARVAADEALASGSVLMMRAYLDEFPTDPQAELVKTVLAALLLVPTTKAPAFVYESFARDFPTAPETPAIRRRGAEVAKTESTEDANTKRRRECTAQCELEAANQCKGIADDGAGADSAKSLCLSPRLRRCCLACGSSIDTRTYARCN